MSELDRQSLLSPFASPVNHQGADTPIIRPHPFSIRPGSSGNPALSLVSPSSAEQRKGSQSESDSLDSSHLRRHDSAGSASSLRPAVKKPLHASDFSPSSQASLRKNSPLLSSARQTSHTSSHPHRAEQDPAPSGDHAPSHPHRCNCHYGNSTTCTTIASCESMGMCPIEDGFVTFDPNRKPRDPCHAHLKGANIAMEDEYSLSHLAACGFLGPAHSLDSAASSAPPSHTSCSSLDSGYDQSWSLTNSSRDSTEFAGSFVLVGSNKNIPHDLLIGANRSVRCASCNEYDSGRGSQCSCPRDRSCRRSLYFDTGTQEAILQARGHPQRADSSILRASSARNIQQGAGVPSQCEEPLRGVNWASAFGMRLPTDSGPLCHSLPPNGRGRGTDTCPLPTQTDVRIDSRNVQVPDPTNSLFPLNLANFDLSKPSDDLPSPLSPDPLERPDSTSLGDVAVSADPTRPLPARKLKNHIRTIEHSRNANRGSSASYATCDPSDPECGNRQFDTRSSLATSSLSATSSIANTTSIPTPGASVSIPMSGRSGQFGTHYNTSSVPVLRTNYATPPSSSSSLQPSSHTPSHTPLSSHACYDARSVCSEADSGRGTKSSLKTGELDTRSLSQISETSYELDPEATLNPLSLPRQPALRANSSPPSTGPRARQDEEVCAVGGACGSLPMLPKVQSGSHQELTDNNYVTDDLALHSLKAFCNNPSILHQRLHQHDEALESGRRPSTLEQFDDLTDVLLPRMDEFHLDMSTQGRQEQAGHRHPMSDFGHSLFVG